MTPAAGRVHVLMIVADLFECAAPEDGCGIRSLRPGAPGPERGLPICACGLAMRRAGYFLWGDK